MNRKLSMTKDELRELLRAAHEDGFYDGVGLDIGNVPLHEAAAKSWGESVTLSNFEDDIKKGKWL